jgi:DNA helicase-2/ATP-dependent DNA helicase PcrA
VSQAQADDSPTTAADDPRSAPLSDPRTAAVIHPGGPLLVLGGAGTGKTRVLADRFSWLVSRGLAPEDILVLVFSAPAADDLRERLESGLDSPSGELSVTTFPELCASLLREESLEAGVDPFAVPVTPADRLAMLLERIDELPLTRHDLRGNPSALLGSIVARIDRLKAELVTSADYEAYAQGLVASAEREPADSAAAARELEFASIYSAHERMLAEAGVLDSGDLVLHAFRLLREKPQVRARVMARYAHVLVDDLQDTSFAQLLLLRLLAGRHGDLTAAGDDDQAIHRFRAAATKNLTEFTAHWPEATVVRLEQSLRSGARILAAAEAVVAPLGDRLAKRLVASPDAAPGEVAFWRCASERAQAQAVAAEVERLIAREDVAPDDVCVLVRSVRGEGQAVAVALEERAIEHAMIGAAAFYQRAEVRDLLAWLRLLTDPADASAVVRALSRPPIELRSVDLARVTQIARRRKLDMVTALKAALESPQVPPEARERIEAFLRLHRDAAAALDSSRPDLYVHRLIERLGLRRQLLFAASAEVAERPAQPGQVRRSWPPPTRAARRRPPRASSPARSPRSPRPGCARRRWWSPSARAACA